MFVAYLLLVNIMATDAEKKQTGISKRWDLDDQQLANYPTVYKEDCLAGKTVLVSGGGTGIGRGISYLMARCGATVIICSRNQENLDGTINGIKKHLNKTVHSYTVNIRQADEVETMMNEIWSTHGGLDILVNNSGGQFPQDAIDFSVNGWNAVIDLNLNGTWYMMQHAARLWKEHQRSGNVVNIIANVRRGMPQVAHTCAARSGVIGLTRSVAIEWAELNIRVNCLAPGSIASHGLEVYSEEVQNNFIKSNPMMKMGDVCDVAEGVVYLGSNAGKFITGEVLSIDGGMQHWGNAWPGGVPDRFKDIYKD